MIVETGKQYLINTPYEPVIVVKHLFPIRPIKYGQNMLKIMKMI